MQRHADLSRRTAYLAPFIRWAAHWSISGPSWLPRWVRRAPLLVASFLVSLHANLAP